jgi:hypothetical protein
MSDQQDERPPGAWILEFDVDLACRRLEPHLESDGGDPGEYQELR